MRLSGHVRTQASSGSSTWQKMRDFGLFCAFYIAVSSRNSSIAQLQYFLGLHYPVWWFSRPFSSRVACKDHKCDSNIQQQDITRLQILQYLYRPAGATDAAAARVGVLAIAWLFQPRAGGRDRVRWLGIMWDDGATSHYPSTSKTMEKVTVLPSHTAASSELSFVPSRVKSNTANPAKNVSNKAWKTFRAYKQQKGGKLWQEHSGSTHMQCSLHHSSHIQRLACDLRLPTVQQTSSATQIAKSEKLSRS